MWATYEEQFHHGFGWFADGSWEGGNQLGGFFTVDLLVFDPLHTFLDGWTGTGLSDGITVGLPGGITSAGLLALVVGLWRVQLAGALLDLFLVQDADDLGQDGELFQSVLLWDVVLVLQVLADFSGQFLGLGHNVLDFLGVLDGLTLVADVECQQWDLWGVLQGWLWLVEFLAAVNGGRG